MDDFTDAQKQQMRSGAYGAVFLVSRADPGMFDMVKESFAASKALSKAPAEMQSVFRGMPHMPKGDAAQTEAEVLADLSSSVTFLSSKDPDQLEAYRKAVMDACDGAAQAANGVNAAESAELSKVRMALGIE